MHNKIIKGFTLVEMLVFVTLTILVMTSSYTIYSTIKKESNDRRDDMEAQVKELTTKRILYNFIKNSGFACKQGSLDQMYYDRTSDSLDDFFVNSNSIHVGSLPLPVSDHLSASLETGCTGDCFEVGTDYIMIKKNQSYTQLVATNSTSNTVILDSVDGISVNDYLVLCNDSDINLVKATAVVPATNTVSLALPPSGSTYYVGDYIGNLSLEILYIRDTGAKDADDNPIYSLYVYIKSGSNRGISHELIRGINGMHVEYGTVLNDVITWNTVSSRVGINKYDHQALRITFSVNDKSFNKIVVL